MTATAEASNFHRRPQSHSFFFLRGRTRRAPASHRIPLRGKAVISHPYRTASMSFQGHYSTSFARRWVYDVFLSFRREDVRSSDFTARLSNALHQKGVKTFPDDEHRRGEENSPALLPAIEDSRVSIVVLSKKYPSSAECLDELVKILECKQKKEQWVLPVFYGVDPSDVRHQRKSFGKALKKLEDRFHGDEKLQGWRAALKEVANLSGWPIGKRNRPKFIHEIVQVVSRIVNCTYLSVAKYPVGIDSRVKDVNLHLGRNDMTCMIGIFGVGGIGKTTIAKEIYNLIAYQFDGSCFLANVREISDQECGLVQLQETLLSEILRDPRNLKVSNVDRGVNMIKYMLHSKRVLLVLDDVDKLNQLEMLAGERNWFGLGSRIIITTRDEKLLKNCSVDVMYKAKELDDKEALELFCWNAFEQDKPVDGYAEFTSHIIQYAKGLPLVLIVLGSGLHGRSIHEWKSALDKYKRTPNKSILEILKITYDGLDVNEKDIFLDIACFFKGKPKNDVMKILDGCGFFSDIGIEVLTEKSLIIIDECHKLIMHDLLQEMGKEIVRQESLEEAGKRSRLWFYEDVRHVLEEHTGTNSIEGILVDLPQRDTIRVSSKAFMRMKRLRLFINRNAHFSDGPSYLSNELRLLDWPEYPLQSLPSNFHGQKLVIFRMRNSLFKELDERFKNFPNLTAMDFSNCQFLTKIPDVSRIPNLEELSLDNCTSLVEVHHSVGFLEKLVILRVLGCSKLGSFPRSLKLRSLEYLNLEDCSNLQSFPEIEYKMEKLGYIGLKCTSIKELPSSIGNAIALQDLNLQGCKNLMNLPSSIHRLQHLRRLSLRDCSKLTSFPQQGGDNRESVNSGMPMAWEQSETQPSADLISFPPHVNSCTSNGGLFPTLGVLDIGNCALSYIDFFLTMNCFSTLEQLDLSGNDFVSIPAVVKRFVGLRSLKVADCKQLQEILELPPKIEDIHASGCISLERFLVSSKRCQFDRCRFPGLEWIDLSRCHRLIESVGDDVENFLLDEGHLKDHQFGIIFPGNKIPNWFCHVEETSGENKCEIDIHEPSDLHGEITGIALSVVIGINDGELPVHSLCSVEIIVNGLPRFSDEKVFDLSGSDHVWLLFHVPEFYELKGNLRVKFWCSITSAFFRSCGAHVVRRVFHEDVEALGKNVEEEPMDIRDGIRLTKRRHDDDDDGNTSPQHKRRFTMLGTTVSQATLIK